MLEVALLVAILIATVLETNWLFAAAAAVLAVLFIVGGPLIARAAVGPNTVETLRSDPQIQ